MFHGVSFYREVVAAIVATLSYFGGDISSFGRENLKSVGWLSRVWMKHSGLESLRF